MEDLDPILECIRRSRKCDLSAYNDATLKRCIDLRLRATGKRTLPEYFEYLERQPSEQSYLLDALTINVSYFFRDSLTFEYIQLKTLPAMLFDKRKASDRMIRIWSAGCAGGEEPYSTAILIRHLHQENDPKIMIFGTDIDQSVLARAREAAFTFEAVKQVKLEFLEKYFSRDGSHFRVVPEIRKMVAFSWHDLTDARSKPPSESENGDFDLVFCSNVLIYLRADVQRDLIHKFHRSLAPDGYLVLGRAEEFLMAGRGDFKKSTDACPIFQKVG
jgi:chemotaxis protein methyltransferase CheR